MNLSLNFVQNEILCQTDIAWTVIKVKKIKKLPLQPVRLDQDYGDVVVSL